MTLENTIIASLEALQEFPFKTEIAHIMIDSIAGDKVPCTSEDAQFMWSPVEITSNWKVSPKEAQLSCHIEWEFEVTCEEFQDIFSQYQGGIQHI